MFKKEILSVKQTGHSSEFQVARKGLDIFGTHLTTIPSQGDSLILNGVSSTGKENEVLSL